MVEYVLNVIEDGELVDVIEGADNISNYLANKDDKVKGGCIVYEEEDND